MLIWFRCFNKDWLMVSNISTGPELQPSQATAGQSELFRADAVPVCEETGAG